MAFCDTEMYVARFRVRPSAWIPGQGKREQDPQGRRGSFQADWWLLTWGWREHVLNVAAGGWGLTANLT